MVAQPQQQFTIELQCVESVIQQHIDGGCTQPEVAEVYAMGICSKSWPTDWKIVNDAITKRWPKGLTRVKEMAWKLLRDKRKAPNDPDPRTGAARQDVK